MTAPASPEGRAPGLLALIAGYLASTRELIASLVKRRKLLFALAGRDVSDEYVQHRFSVLWALVMPMFLVGMYVFVFTSIFATRLRPPESFTTDAIVYLFAGLTPWISLNMAAGRSMTAIVNNANIVKQMSFPLELLPVKALVSPLIFMGVSLLFVIAYSGWITGGAILPFYALSIPIVVVITLATFLGLAVGLAALQVYLRDTKEFVTIFLSIGLFLHPILYAPDAIPEAVRGAIYASPLSYLIFCWQDALFYGAFERPFAWFVSAAFAALCLVFSARLFMASKPYFGEFL